MPRGARWVALRKRDRRGRSNASSGIDRPGGRPKLAHRARPHRYGRTHILPERRGDALIGSRDREPIEILFGPELHLDYFTPATNAITCRRLTGTTEIEVVYVEAHTLEVSRVRQRYALGGDERVHTPVGLFATTR